MARVSMVARCVPNTSPLAARGKREHARRAAHSAHSTHLCALAPRGHDVSRDEPHGKQQQACIRMPRLEVRMGEDKGNQESGDAVRKVTAGWFFVVRHGNQYQCMQGMLPSWQGTRHPQLLPAGLPG